MRDRFLPFAQPLLGDEELRAVLETLSSGWLTMGPRVEAFEEAFRHWVGCEVAIAVSSATAALHLALLSLGIGTGDEVITTPFTFASTANAIVLTGATPVFVDVDDSTLDIDPEQIPARITAATKAILVVHFAGRPCDMARIEAIAAAHGLHLVEDAAHALGARYRGRRIGAASDWAAFSFYPTKNITAAEGGMLVGSDRSRLREVRELRWYGLSDDVWERSKTGREGGLVVRPGFKYNMSDLQAALGLAQLRRLDDFNATRKAHAELYTERLGHLEEIRLPEPGDADHESSWHLFVIRLDRSRLTLDRAAFRAALAELNVGTGYQFRSLHLHPYYRERFGLEAGDFPVAAGASDEVVSLPLYPKMTERDVLDVVEAVEDVVSRHRV